MNLPLHQVFHRILDKTELDLYPVPLFLYHFSTSFTFTIETKKSPEGLKLRKHGIPTPGTSSWITGTGTKLATDDSDRPAISRLPNLHNW